MYKGRSKYFHKKYPGKRSTVLRTNTLVTERKKTARPLGSGKVRSSTTRKPTSTTVVNTLSDYKNVIGSKIGISCASCQHKDVVEIDSLVMNQSLDLPLNKLSEVVKCPKCGVRKVSTFIAN
jgi:hypothetical protein